MSAQRRSLHHKDALYSPYTRKTSRKPKLEHVDRPLFDSDQTFAPFIDCSSSHLPHTKSIRADGLGHTQRLLFKNIKIGANEISTLLDKAVLDLLPIDHFSSPLTLSSEAIEFRSTNSSRGVGAFSVCPIPSATLIHVEYPVTVVQNTLVLLDLSSSEVYRELFRRVPQRLLPALMSLCNSQPASSKLDPEEAILRTNAIGISLPLPKSFGADSTGHNAVFLQASRFNHSCAPNATARFDPESFTLTVHALRPIKKGEELFISYIDLTSPSMATRDTRRAELLHLYHFSCCCAICSLSDVSESDTRRLRINQTSQSDIFAPFSAWYSNPNRTRQGLDSVMTFYLKATNDMAKEGLVYRFRYYLHLILLAGCYAAIKDTRNFRSWLGKARDVANSSYLASKEAEKLFHYIMNPTTFPAWGRAT
ncbi:SET domain-containing protein [Mycena indigotica]|uniref:SET domain-containing protein n=1 Tax=Mycena indigotica TaxID=2126181 RepID=A0A8H6TD01_9AGAR|nr:SET domain-containing protein [Mycena indigotica]KAF7315428.1 SET domain-containing protein [Mycena indigotica]